MYKLVTQTLYILPNSSIARHKKKNEKVSLKNKKNNIRRGVE